MLVRSRYVSVASGTVVLLLPVHASSLVVAACHVSLVRYERGHNNK